MNMKVVEAFVVSIVLKIIIENTNREERMNSQNEK